MNRGTQLAVLATAAGLAVLMLATPRSPATGAVAQSHQGLDHRGGEPFLRPSKGWNALPDVTGLEVRLRKQ